MKRIIIYMVSLLLASGVQAKGKLPAESQMTDYSFNDGVLQVHEAPMVWKLIGQPKWILMQDRYSMEPHNFYFCETTDFKTFTPLGYFDEPDCPMKRTNFSEQKQGAVVQVTKRELKRLINYWKRI